MRYTLPNWHFNLWLQVLMPRMTTPTKALVQQMAEKFLAERVQTR